MPPSGPRSKRRSSFFTRSGLARLWSISGTCSRRPKNAYAYFFLGVAFFSTGEIAPARDAYSACLKLAPDHLGARVAMSHVLRILGDLRGAVREE